MRQFDGLHDATEFDLLVAPIELAHLAGCEGQRDEGLVECRAGFAEFPALDEALDAIIGAAIALGLQPLEQAPRGAALGFWQQLLGLQPALQPILESAEHRGGLLSSTVDRLCLGPAKSADEREFAIQQILDRAVVSTEIVDILAAAGITTPDISILSDQFLVEVQQLEKKNLALEALRKLLNDEIRSRSRTNVVETKRFSERLEAAIARYHTNAISTVEVLQELIDLAKEVRAARKRGEEEGLSQDEIAFYDALAENESAVEAMGNDSLKVIAHELLTNLNASASVDWSHREP